MKNTLTTLVLFTAFFAQAQVGIGVSTTNMNTSAQLEVASTTKGFLAPRMTASERALIASPAAGLLVFQTDGTSGFYYYDGAWKQGLGPQGDIGVAGAAGQTNTSLLYSSSSIYTDGAAPTDAPTAVTSTHGNFGWYFKNTNSSRKINWYIAPKSSTMKVSDLTGLYLEMFNVAITSASDMPYIIVYTKATGSGDAASWYKSRRMYTFNATPTANTKYLGFANLGATTPNTYNTNLLDLVAGTSGSFASTEEISTIAIASSSVSAAGACEFVANKLGVITGTSTQEFLFMPPSSIANLSGYATTSALDLKAPLASPTFTGTVAGITKTMVGLSDVDNTSDLLKPISTDTQTALDAKANSAGQVFTGAISATNLSGTNSGDNAPNTLYSSLATNANHTGDVTGSSILTIADGAVTEAKIADNAVTTAKIANGSVTAFKIADGAVTDIKIDTVSGSKVTGTVAVANGGTGTSNGSITGTSALTFTASGTNQNVTLTPSGSGSSILNGTVGIGTSTPAASAQLEVTSTSKGFLPPRVALTGPDDVTTIVSPAEGLIVYNTTLKSVQVFNGTVWYSTAHYIGESYGGGIVFYVYDNGQHGLIAATADQSTAIRWYGGSWTNTRARGDGIGAGLKNTTIIIANQGPFDGAAFAATVCNEYSVTIGGVTYGDWYLPSKHELNLLYLKKDVVGGFANYYYWSSTEISSNNAWIQDFSNSLRNYFNKDNANYVRAVRAF